MRRRVVGAARAKQLCGELLGMRKARGLLLGAECQDRRLRGHCPRPRGVGTRTRRATGRPGAFTHGARSRVRYLFTTTAARPGPAALLSRTPHRHHQPHLLHVTARLPGRTVGRGSSHGAARRFCAEKRFHARAFFSKRVKQHGHGDVLNSTLKPAAYRVARAPSPGRPAPGPCALLSLHTLSSFWRRPSGPTYKG